ncbi:major facilitator superfamily domain-containing protein [Aspergillus terricola var. indicus]
MLQLLCGPSVSPVDPITWNRLRKELLFATIILGSCATSSLGPLLLPGFVVVATNLQSVMALGVSAYACSSFARSFGKRPVYLFTTFLVLASCCWAAVSELYSSLIASRVFQGLGMGSFFALVGTASINDVFAVHERGRRVGLWNFAVIVSVNLTPVISGYVITALSWLWAFWLEAILFGVLLAAVLLCFPRPPFNTLESEEKAHPPAVIRTISTQGNNSLLLALVEPLPIVVGGCIKWAATFTWAILLGAVASQLLTAPPWNMSTVAVGNLTGIAPLIGSALETVLSGWLCDLCSRSMASRNGGVHEPEFRLPVILPATVATAAGTFGLGAAMAHGLSPVACGVLMAILNFAVGMGCTGIVAYTNDVCGERAADGFGLAMVAKIAFAFGLTFVFNDFVAESGLLVFFSTGAISAGVMLTTVPLYFWGKGDSGLYRAV